jgi:hypothetical protein
MAAKYALGLLGRFARFLRQPQRALHLGLAANRANRLECGARLAQIFIATGAITDLGDLLRALGPRDRLRCGFHCCVYALA